MISLKRKILSGISRGSSGAHLTAYLPEVDSKENLNYQLDCMLEKSANLLIDDYGEEFTKEFLKPIRRMRNDQSLIEKKGNGCWALFRTESSFRFKKMPVKLPSLTVVSDSFHIKPLIKWAQSEKSCYVLSINEKEALLFAANLKRIELIARLPLGTHYFRDSIPTRLDELQFKYAAIDWLDDWIADVIEDNSKPLILAGRDTTVSSFWFKSRYPLIVKEFISGNFNSDERNRLQTELTRLLHEISGREIVKSLKLFNRARFRGNVSFSLEEISNEAVKGRIRRLFIAEDHYIWGILCRETGSYVVHHDQRNSLDDDLLDDLAEIVLDKGSEVVLLPSRLMPDQAPLAAILKRPTESKINASRSFYSSREIA